MYWALAFSEVFLFLFLLDSRLETINLLITVLDPDDVRFTSAPSPSSPLFKWDAPLERTSPGL